MFLRVLGVALVGGMLAACGQDDDPIDLDALDADLATDLASDMAVPDSAEPDLAVAVDLGADLTGDILPIECDADAGIPSSLACAGLYSDFPSKTVAASIEPFEPGYHLWSDGATKRRWILLPGQIDVSVANAWVFPVGTKLFKEFSLDVSGVSHRIETRMWWKRGTGDWVPVVYRWNANETDASRLTNGEANVLGTGYEVPAENRCTECHVRDEKVAGFEMVLLAAPTATGLTWDMLKSKGLVTSSNGNHACSSSSAQIPGSATEKAALGYLHANCGVACHHFGSPAPTTVHWDIDVGSSPPQAPTTVDMTNAWASINNSVAHTLQPANDPGGSLYELHPLDPTHSLARIRMSVRDAPFGASGLDQMPPIVTHKPDTAGLQVIDDWLDYMTIANGYPAPM